MSRGNVGSAPAWVYQCGVAPFFPPEEESPRAIHLSHVNGNHYRALPLACASGPFCAVASAIREREKRNFLDASAFRSAGSSIPLSSEHVDTFHPSCLHCGLDHESGCCPNYTVEQRRSYNAVLGLPDDRGRLLEAQRQHAAVAADWVDNGGCEFGYAAPLSFFCERECGGGGMCAWNSLAFCLRTCGFADDATATGIKGAVAMWAFANWEVPQARRPPTWGHTVKELVCHRLEGGHSAEHYLVGGRDFYGAKRWGCLPSDPELKRKYAEMIRESAVWATELELYLAACALGVHVHV